MGIFSTSICRDFEEGISLEEGLTRLATYLDAWISDHANSSWKKQVEERLASLEVRVSRLESLSQTDKQTLDEVDESLQQTWRTLDQRIKALEEKK